MKILFHLLLIIGLTVITQIGGIVYILTLLVFQKAKNKTFLKGSTLFIFLYSIATFIVTPTLAPIFGREKIKETAVLEAHSFFYKFANRNYVKPELQELLDKTSKNYTKNNKNMKLIHLDASFPFFNKFPLLPHLSHNDGKKIDISLVYLDAKGELTNKKPSISGYGVFENPTIKEHNQTLICQQRGYWQYDFPKYLTLGTINKDITFSNNGTRNLVVEFLKNKNLSKVFIEPHLKSRLNLSNNKIRFHGCGAVRHDDHIHIQIK
ncbi:hypothetical protein [Dokdonia sp. PRO95]|uniref:hypothetical protein n=1 Tax=Dokdonia sp. PRO95 TaxID=1239415 RepID=UPI00068CCF6F|nr:hypothetical protein [Dokdonia sp. PRO95]